MAPMNRPTVITRVHGRECVVEPSTAQWYVAPRDTALIGSPVTPPAEQPTASAPPEPLPAGLDELWVYTNLDCNLSCRHCFLGESTRASLSDRPTLAGLTGLVDEAVDSGARTIFFTGGEPFARADLPALLAHAAGKADVAVLTNATLIDEAMIARFDREGLGSLTDRLSFQVSIDGPAAAHDAMRGNGAHGRAVRGIRLLSEWGVRPALVTALGAANAAQAPHVTALAARLGLRVHHLLLPHRDGRMECDGGAGAASPSQVLAAIRACRIVAEKNGVVLSNDSVIASRVKRPGRLYDGCTGGQRMLAVGADGTVYPCPSLVGSTELGVRTASLADALAEGPIARFASRSLCDRTRCSACEVRHFCGGGCSAHAWRANDDEAEPYCEVYRGLVTDHIEREAERLLAMDPESRVVRPALASAPTPVRHRFACT